MRSVRIKARLSYIGRESGVFDFRQNMAGSLEEAHTVIFGCIPEQVAARDDDSQEPVIDRNREYNRLIVRHIGPDLRKAEHGGTAERGIFGEIFCQRMFQAVQCSAAFPQFQTDSLQIVGDIRFGFHQAGFQGR